jgi:hypothetical protein
VSHLHGLFAYFNEGARVQINKLVVWVFALIQVGVCGLLWFFPRTVAAWLLPLRDSGQEAPPPPRLLEWQTLGVICIGLWALARAIPDAVYWITVYNMATTSGMGFSAFAPEQKAAMFETIVELIIGVWLLLGAKGLALLLFRVRTAGLSR